MRWYFVLDFESTCFEGKRDHPSEISNAVVTEMSVSSNHFVVEFPVVILDAKKGVIVDTFRRFVRPTENPELSAFCTKLTGIRQVVFGLPFLVFFPF